MVTFLFIPHESFVFRHRIAELQQNTSLVKKSPGFAVTQYLIRTVVLNIFIFHTG